MSDNLDKFVLQYIVETRDSIKRLEQLTDKMDEAEKKAVKGGGALQTIGGHLRGVASEAGSAGEAVVGLSDGLAGLAATAGPIAGVIGVIMILKKVLQETKGVMDELMAQRDLGARVGMSALSVENITRNVSRAKGSQVDRAGVEDIITKLASKLRNAYTDPTQMNRDAILLRQSGVSINGASGGINDTQTALQQLAERFKASTEEQAHAYGQLLGFTQQQVDAMRDLGSSITDTTHMTAAEVVARQVALDRANELKAASVSLSEHWRELKDDILVHVIPALDSLTTHLDGLVNKSTSITHGIGEMWKQSRSHTLQFIGAALMNPTGSGAFFKAAATIGKASDEMQATSKVDAEQAKHIKDAADQSNRQANQQATEMERIINMFSQSVSQFSNNIDERQAWAAWAGEIGRANGLGLSGNVARGLTGTGGNSAAFDPVAQVAMQTGRVPSGGSARDAHMFDDIYQKAAAATGLPAELIKKVAMAESNQNPVAVSKAGAQGIMQIMPSNFAALGITDARNPQQNIMGGARLLAQLYKQYGNYEDALRAYNGGQDRSKWGNPETAAYVGRVMSQNATITAANDPMMSPLMRYQLDPKARALYQFNGTPLINPAFGGESREKSQLLNIQTMLAQSLGVPLAQVQQGDVSTGDVKYAASNIMAQLANSRYALKNQLNVPGMNPVQRGSLQQQLRTTDLQIQGMMRYMPQIQQQAMPGDRNITIGQGAVQVIVQGANVSPEELAREINNTFGDHLNEVVHGYADGVSH